MASSMSRPPPPTKPKPPPPGGASAINKMSPSLRPKTTHFDISQLPSLRDGMTAEEECMKRRKTCRFIEEAGRVLKLPRVAVSTAMVFFHRFYAKHSFNEHDRFEVAVAAIVLAAKTEESPKKLKDVILECHKLKTRGMQAGRISQQKKGSSPPPPLPNENLDPKEEEFAKLKERILLLERVILHTIGFELSIDHPYKFFVERIKKLIHNRQLKYKNPSPEKTNTKLMNDLVQNSMSLANDSMHTSLCLQFPPQSIATSCIYLAAQFAKVEPSVSSSSQSNSSSTTPTTTTNPDSLWPTLLGNPDIESFASICIQIIELISDRKSSDTALIKKIRAQLELLKSRSEQQQQQQQQQQQLESTNTNTTATGGNIKKSPPPPPPPGGPPDKRQKL